MNQEAFSTDMRKGSTAEDTQRIGPSERRFQGLLASQGETLTTSRNIEVKLCFKGNSSAGRLQHLCFCRATAYREDQEETWQNM